MRPNIPPTSPHLTHRLSITRPSGPTQLEINNNSSNKIVPTNTTHHNLSPPPPTDVLTNKFNETIQLQFSNQQKKQKKQVTMIPQLDVNAGNLQPWKAS